MIMWLLSTYFIIYRTVSYSCHRMLRRPWLWRGLDSDGNGIAQCQHQTNGGRDSPQIRHSDTVVFVWRM